MDYITLLSYLDGSTIETQTLFRYTLRILRKAVAGIIKNKNKIILAAAILLVVAVALIYAAGQDKPENETIVIAMPRGEFIRNMDTNYYKLWLEEQTGLQLTFINLEDGYTAGYLDNAFSNGDVHVDAFFSLDTGDDYLSMISLLQDFGDKGYILPIDGYLDGATNLERIFTDFDTYDLREIMTSPDGSIYFMPGLDASRGQSTESVLWLNKSWLSALKLAVPQTTEQFYEVLKAFATMDPNGNGLADEIPLCGTLESDGQQLYNNIINSFIYCAPDNSYLLVEGGTVIFAPYTDEWRSAMQYLNRLYEDGFISPLLLDLSGRAFSELANNPSDLLGGFTADHVTDVLLQNAPEIISNYIHVAPLEGPNGQRNATVKPPIPKVAGVITASCKNPQAVFDLFDLMLSEEAFLIGRYGEEGVDWERAAVTNLDFYGGRAEISIISHLTNKMQNQHITELGPFYSYPMYADGVSYGGLEADQEYINARAVRAYELYMPAKRLGTALYMADNAHQLLDLRNDIDAYTKDCIIGFITGKLNPYDDIVWQGVIKQYNNLGTAQLIDAAQASYNSMEGE